MAEREVSDGAGHPQTQSYSVCEMLYHLLSWLSGRFCVLSEEHLELNVYCYSLENYLKTIEFLKEASSISCSKYLQVHLSERRSSFLIRPEQRTFGAIF